MILTPCQSAWVKLFDRIRLPFDGSTTCWEWVGTRVRKNSYGILYVDGKRYRAHRVAFEMFNGKEIPKEMSICHTCDHPWCVNPYHLFCGTHSENMQDKIAKKRDYNVRKTHCHKGHLLAGDNLMKSPPGRRRCRACTAVRNLASYHRNKHKKRIGDTQ